LTDRVNRLYTHATKGKDIAGKTTSFISQSLMVTVGLSKLGYTSSGICRSQSQGRWSLLLWLASVTTVTTCHTSGLWRVHLSARQCSRVQGKRVFWH